MHSCWPPSLSWSLRSGPWPRRKSRLPLPVWRSFPPSPASRSAWSNFNRQNDRNQAFNHAGNMVGAAVSGYLGWRYGYTAVFLLAAVFGAISIVCVLMIPRQAIDNRAARGKEEDPESQPSGFTGLPCWSSTSRSSYSHLRLPPSISATRRSFPSMVWRRPSTARRMAPLLLRPRFVVAQGVMILTSIIGMRVAESRNYWPVLLVSFLALPIRGILAF